MCLKTRQLTLDNRISTAACRELGDVATDGSQPNDRNLELKVVFKNSTSESEARGIIAETCRWLNNHLDTIQSTMNRSCSK